MTKISYSLGLTFAPKEYASVRVDIGVSDLDINADDFEAQVEKAMGTLQYTGRQVESALSDEASTASGLIVESAVGAKDFQAFRENTNKAINKIVAEVKRLGAGGKSAKKRPEPEAVKPAAEPDTADTGGAALSVPVPATSS